ncbi:MAG: T9SS type A sorting domain-containing protein [Bacteroidia bacterium]|nr:T9SS type A sorting domain-containing protein [Bacteroidia bacterium]MDW8016005.1 T9SS type A sorting domain-containing protein [Bacteroidia bacterium]
MLLGIRGISLWSSVVYAQVVLLSGSGEGSFENEATCLPPQSQGWTAYPHTHRWIIGSAAGAVHGLQAAYVSSYGSEDSCAHGHPFVKAISHLVREISVPPSINLLSIGFRARSFGKRVVMILLPYYDCMEVYLVPVGSPIAGGSPPYSRTVGGVCRAQNWERFQTFAAVEGGETYQLLFTWRTRDGGSMSIEYFPPVLDSIEVIGWNVPEMPLLSEAASSFEGGGPLCGEDSVEFEGWTILNGHEMARWTISDLPSPPGGGKALHVTSDTHQCQNYEISLSYAVIHFYRKVRLPSEAGLLKLRADVRGENGYFYAWLVAEQDSLRLPKVGVWPHMLPEPHQSPVDQTFGGWQLVPHSREWRTFTASAFLSGDSAWYVGFTWVGEPLEISQIPPAIDNLRLSWIPESATYLPAESQAPNILIYPHPFTHTFYLWAQVWNTEPLLLQITDAKGQVVYFTSYLPYHGQIHTQINLSGLPAGLYYLSLSQGQRRIAKPLLKL